jgi:hypothetical protein
MSEPRHYYYNATVKFVGNYFVMTIPVILSIDADDERDLNELAIEQGAEMLYDHYGWQVEDVSNDIEVEISDGY